MIIDDKRTPTVESAVRKKLLTLHLRLHAAKDRTALAHIPVVTGAVSTGTSSLRSSIIPELAEASTTGQTGSNVRH